MKVIKCGSDKTFYVRCSKCKSTIEYTMADVIHAARPYETLHGTKQCQMEVINCPACSNELLATYKEVYEHD